MLNEKSACMKIHVRKLPDFVVRKLFIVVDFVVKKLFIKGCKPVITKQ